MFNHKRIGTRFLLPIDLFDELIDLLSRAFDEVVGPVVRDGAIGYGRISSRTEMPAGRGDEQGPGHYRLVDRGDGALFHYVVGQDSLKRFFFEPRQVLFEATRDDGLLKLKRPRLKAPRRAFVGVRACELEALAIQDRVFLESGFCDPHYSVRRQGAFFVAVDCPTAAPTCFCTSMGGGPRVTRGFDIVLSELLDGEGHRFVVEVGSEQGAELLELLELGIAPTADQIASQQTSDRVTAQITRRVDAEHARRELPTHPTHRRWHTTSERCMSCSNCTMVCPTCFCSTVTDHAELDCSVATRVRHWDSCFSLEHSYIHGGYVRSTSRSRYRQWLTHKFSTWDEQFGTAGCVGCGRCITCCPVGIDVTEELKAICSGSAEAGGGDNGNP